MSEYDDEDNYAVATCPICDAEMELVQCWHCQGEGGFHECGEDCCACLNKDEITEACSECDGQGRYLQCGALPHSDEQMAEYSRQQDQADNLKSGGTP